MTLSPGVKNEAEQEYVDQGLCPACFAPIRNFEPRASEPQMAAFRRFADTVRAQGFDLSERLAGLDPATRAVFSRIVGFVDIGRDPTTGHLLSCNRPKLRIVVPSPEAPPPSAA